MKRSLVLPFLLVSLLAAQVPEVEITAEPSHHLALENSYVRVFKVEVAAHSSTLMHRHRHDYLFVTIGDARVSNEVEGKAAVELKLTDGETHFVAGGFAHIAKDLADGAFRNVTVEILQDEELRQKPSTWPRENGEENFAGGRSKILFVKDGVRASEINLEPGATVPRHHHDAPHLIVALTDLSLRSDIEGGASSAGQVKSGDVRWVPGGFTHTLTNTSKYPARFVAFEF